MSLSDIFVISIVLFGLLFARIHADETASSSFKAEPPTLNTHFIAKDYFHGSNLTLNCMATGVPDPKYTWLFNGEVIEITDKRRYKIIGGQLRILYPTEYDDGYYQCKASNQYGAAVTREILLTEAKTYAWQKMKVKPEVAFENEHKILRCRNKPESSPKPMYKWHIDQAADVHLDKRVAIDQEGSLHFINSKISDSSDPTAKLNNRKYYYCSSYNKLLKSRNYGSETSLIVHKKGDPSATRKPSISYATKSGVTVKSGEDLELQCIPDGVPIPDMIWKKGDRTFSTSGRTRITDFTRKLTIKQVVDTDQGVYECITDTDSSAKKQIVVKVVSRPIWIHRPESLTVVEGTDVELNCDARSANDDGFVSVSWLRNGVGLTDGYNGKVLVDGSRLSIKNVQKPDDIMSIQCNVSNKHGYQLNNAALNVIKVTKIESNMKHNRLLEKGEFVEMRVKAFPDPLYIHDLTINWYHNNLQITNKDTSQSIYISGHSLYVVSNNDTTEEVFQGLMGNYTCVVDVGIPSAKTVLSMGLFTENPPLPSVIKAAGFPMWIIGLIVGSILLILLIILIVFLMYRNRGDVWKIEEKERKAGRDVEKELEQCAFPTLSRASHIPDEYKYPPNANEVRSMEDDQKLIHDDTGEDFAEQELNIFDEDGSFIGEYDASKRPSNPEPPAYTPTFDNDDQNDEQVPDHEIIGETKNSVLI